MTGTYLDSNEDTFWSNVSSISGGSFHEEEMALLSVDKNAGSDQETPLSTYQIPSQTAIVKWRKSKSYNFNEVATNLRDTAEKALEEANLSNSGYKRNSISRSVAQIVLEESNKNVDSSVEYIAGIVQKVARYAQDSGPDGEMSGSAANQVTQPEDTTSLGTMMSFFVIWCVSLCASHLDRKDLPPPVLKLAAEEVASVLQSNCSPRSGTT